MSGARGYSQVPKGYPPATPNLQKIDKNHKIHSKYTSQHKTNNVQHISKKKIQNGTAGCFWTLEIIYISIVGKSSTSIPPSLEMEALDTLPFPGVYATQSTRQQNKSHGIPA